MQFKMISSISIIIILQSALSCSLPGQKEIKTEEPPIIKTEAEVALPSRQIIPDVSMKIDSTLSYSLYIPSAYSIRTKWPVLLMFDASARGILPLNLYRETAERFGYILMCSNNSKNGNPVDFTKHIISSMIAEATSRYAVDTNRIYSAGFSGGGRVAALGAFMNPAIKGVIGIGAGFPGDQLPEHPFRFIGVAGKEDFNYKELSQLNEQLSVKNIPHLFFIYNGKHDWCPADIIYKSLALFNADAMRMKTLSVDTGLLHEINKTNASDVKHLKSEQRFIEAGMLLNYLLECNKDLVETQNLKKEIVQLQQSKTWQNQQQQQHLLTIEEGDLSQKLMQSIGKPLNWWQEEVNKISMQINASPGSEHTYMLKRVMAGIRVQCNGIAKQMLYNPEIEKANYIVTLYKIVEPDYKDPWYFSAVMNALGGNKDMCFNDLNRAIEKGFDDRNRLLNEPAFQSLQSESAFASLLSKIPVR